MGQGGELELLHKEYKVILGKNVKMRIGFLHKSVSSYISESKPSNMASIIMLAFCMDSSFAMAGAVALHSAIDATSGRMMVYIQVIDCQ